MEDSFFGFNTALPGLLDEELHDEPGQGLDEEEEEEYDALNDETFGTDAVEGDWEEDHEKLAEITEQSRARCGSYGAEGADRSEEAEHDTGLELEASLAQLVLDDYEDDLVVENGSAGAKLQNHRPISIAASESYSSSAPSGYSVWTPTKQESHLQNVHPAITPSLLPGKNVVSVEELERGLLSQRHSLQSHQLKQQPPLLVAPPPGLGPSASSSVLRLEDVERDLTVNAGLPVHLSRAHTQLAQHPDMVLLRNTQNAAAVASLGRGHFPGRLPPPPKAQVMPLGRGQVMLPGGRFGGPPGVHPGLPGIHDLRQLPQQNHRLVGSAPNLLRFIPPHLMVPPGQGQGGKGIPHPGGFPGDNGLLFPNHHGLGPFRPGIPHLDQHRPGGQNIYGPRQDRQGTYFSNNRNGGPNSNYQHPNRGIYHHYYNHNRCGNQNNQEYDEYAGLMTVREKHWLLNIQILQLNTDRPHIDDYYYTVFQARQPKSEQDKDRDRKRDVHRERRDSFRDREPRQESQPRVYTPAQFENSLGKLQIGSVTAPRKIIDMDVVSHEGVDTVPTSNQRDTKKAKQVLLEIERLYLLLLQIEDLSSTVPGVRESVTEEKPVLVQRIMSSLLIEDRVVSVMCIRKGKTLILRFLPHLPATDNGPPQLLTLWSRLLRGLVAIGRRDQGADAMLPRFHPYFHRWVATLPFAPLLQLARSLIPGQGEGNTSTPTPMRTASPVGRNVLTYAMSNKFGLSALASMLNRAEILFPTLDSSQQQDWTGFLNNLFETTVHIASPDNLPTPLEPLSTSLASQHLGRHECVHIERYALMERIFTRRDSLATSGEKSNENLA